MLCYGCLEETAIGAAVAIAVVVLVLPLHTRRVARLAMRRHVEALSGLLGHAAAHLLGDDVGPSTLRGDARAIDASYHALITTVKPLQRNLMGNIDEPTAQALRLVTASRNYGRNLVVDVESAGPLDDGTRADVARGADILRRGADVLAAALTGPRDGTYVRSSSIFDRADRRLEERSSGVDGGQLAIRDLKLVDGALAGLASTLGLPVTDFDTVGVSVAPQ